MEHIVSPRDRIGPANIRIEIGRRELDCAGVRGDLADRRAYPLGSPKVPNRCANAPAFVENSIRRCSLSRR
jgi:hypothetical protein